MIIDIYNLLYNLLPYRFYSDTDFWVDYLRAAMEPLRTLNQRVFLAVGYNSSIGSQELYLNRLYGNPYNVNTRAAAISAGTIIWIENWDTTVPQTFLYNTAENQTPLYIYNTAESEPPLYLYNQIEFDGDWDFRVWVPLATSLLPAYDVNQLKGQINKYLPEGRRYIIQIY